jgi:hypothetical protein
MNTDMTISHDLSVRCHISVHSTLLVTFYQLDVISVFILRYLSRFISYMSYQSLFYDISHILSVRCHISVHFTLSVTIYQLDVIPVFILRYIS